MSNHLIRPPVGAVGPQVSEKIDKGCHRMPFCPRDHAVLHEWIAILCATAYIKQCRRANRSMHILCAGGGSATTGKLFRARPTFSGRHQSSGGHASFVAGCGTFPPGHFPPRTYSHRDIFPARTISLPAVKGKI